MRKKKAQHEIMGFILIVVIVVVIGLFLLVFYLRQPSVVSKSENVENFLHSSMLYTTPCYLSLEPLSLQEVIKSCYREDRCVSGERACEVLENTFSELVQESWMVSSQRPVNSYSIIIYYEEETKEEILTLKEGNCTGDRTGAEHFMHHYPGNIVTSMEICYI